MNSQGHVWPSESLLPNDLGLFALLGNGNEWVHDKYQRYKKDANYPIYDNINNTEKINEDPRLIRGGGFGVPTAFVRSAFRNWIAPSFRDFDNGFRPARTCN